MKVPYFDLEGPSVSLKGSPESLWGLSTGLMCLLMTYEALVCRPETTPVSLNEKICHMTEHCVGLKIHFVEQKGPCTDLKGLSGSMRVSYIELERSSSSLRRHSIGINGLFCEPERILFQTKRAPSQSDGPSIGLTVL